MYLIFATPFAEIVTFHLMHCYPRVYATHNKHCLTAKPSQAPLPHMTIAETS
jgi:hypothetical protein